MTVTPVVAAVTTLCASLALAGVIDGLRWWGYAGVAVTVVTAIGLGLRAIRTPVLLVGLAQMFALLCLLVALFTSSGVLGVFPGPAALNELGDVLANSITVVRTGVPPVPAEPAVLCLVVIAIGLVAVLVDTLAVSAGTPAACGLVLLCVYAVPASLADEMLPWWAFVLGALSFAALLAVDGAHRHQMWRNRPTVQGTNGGLGGPAALVSGAVAIALFAGAAVTVIGTVGQLPGGSNGGGQDGLGLRPFTSLRGMLDRGDNVEMFRVRGMDDQARYLRAMTLPTYEASGQNAGWGPENEKEMPQGVAAANQNLPLPPGARVPNDRVKIDIEPINSTDFWAPVVGVPLRLRGLPDDMRYDAPSGMVYSQEKRSLLPYIEEADLTEPSREQLRGDGFYNASQDIDPIYLRDEGIPQSVIDLANRLTAGKSSMYDQVQAIKTHFDPVNGFKYDTQTAAGSGGSALEDFLQNKVGFCEQYASAMGILLRAAGIPSRLAIGYNIGYQNGDYRTITSNNAHAWVEVYFPSAGWLPFDPTPRSDGTTYNPPYADNSGPTGPSDDPNNPSASSAAPPVTSTPNSPTDQETSQQAGAGANGQQNSGTASWLWWTITGIGLIAIVLTGLGVAAARTPRRRGRLLPVAVVAWGLLLVFGAALVSWWLAALVVVLLLSAAPGLVRERRRLSRRHEIQANGPAAATSAWSELLAESRDRGIEVDGTETVRVAARRMAREHALDDGGKRALRTVVTEVERSWYGGSETPDPTLAPAFDDLITGMRRSSPLNWRAKLLPRSVLRR
jgi:transglutaminase-like putative cysteine protease